MKITTIASSSSGNAFIVKRTHDTLVIDCGVRIKPKYDILLITHRHGDHDKFFVQEIMRHRFSCGEKVLDELITKHGKWIADKFIPLHEINVRAFEVNHDVPCYAYVISDENESYCHITDTTMVECPDYAHNCTYYSIESNYDEISLQQSARPMMLVNRIIDNGHMSNTHSFKLTQQLWGKDTKAVMYIHLSTQTNSVGMAEMEHSWLEEKYGVKYNRVYGIKGESIGEEAK